MEIDRIFKWAKIKGVDIVGTGDFTHPFWFSKIKEKLIPDSNGLLNIKDKPEIKFILTAEISSIYSEKGLTRKIHTMVFVPTLEAAQAINERLTGIGNLYSDGRPILGLSAHDLAKIILDIEPSALIIPAHAWTPWFSVFGSNSGFDSLKECFKDLTENIYAIETGLSSDPEMNWRLSALDNISLISNSDAHSPSNLAREANVFDFGKLSYDEIYDTIKNKDRKKFLYTIEFYPEEGKYHFDGHRNCNVSFDPFKKRFKNDICPVCGKKLTVGVMHRIDELADREPGYSPENNIGSKHLIPLPEIIADAEGVSKGTQAVERQYNSMISYFGNELKILQEIELKDLAAHSTPKISEGIGRMREGKIKIEAGYDGIYGKVNVFDKENSEPNQESLF